MTLTIIGTNVTSNKKAGPVVPSESEKAFIEASILDHGKFLKENIRYEQAGVFNAKNYKEQAEALLRAGYATDPNYSNKLCSMIESYSLDQYDNVQNNTQT